MKTPSADTLGDWVTLAPCIDDIQAFIEAFGQTKSNLWMRLSNILQIQRSLEAFDTVTENKACACS